MSRRSEAMANAKRRTLAEIEAIVCDICSDTLGIPREQIRAGHSLAEDLGCDSLDAVEVLMNIERGCGVYLSGRSPLFKTIFARKPFLIADLAELVYVHQSVSGSWRRAERRKAAGPVMTVEGVQPFTQLDGRWERDPKLPLFESLGLSGGLPLYRRRSDGMTLLKLSGGTVELGCDSNESMPDERPTHTARLDPFAIDIEPVSTTAWCRFVNSISGTTPETWADWFVLPAEDDRNQHALVTHSDDGWKPVAGAERWPMMLVSWYGANAYSLWANGRDWRSYRDDEGPSFLPSEAQWEYAARGVLAKRFPWGEAEATPERANFGRHERGATYRADTLPLANVNDLAGVSPFGLLGMAGNVWQWCRDWYDPEFYGRPEASGPNPVNRTPTGVRSERGGSWVGPADLCRSSYRRGRPPVVRGRCLGFRCVKLVVAEGG